MMEFGLWTVNTMESSGYEIRIMRYLIWNICNRRDIYDMRYAYYYVGFESNVRMQYASMMIPMQSKSQKLKGKNSNEKLKYLKKIMKTKKREQRVNWISWIATIPSFLRINFTKIVCALHKCIVHKAYITHSISGILNELINVSFSMLIVFVFFSHSWSLTDSLCVHFRI